MHGEIYKHLFVLTPPLKRETVDIFKCGNAEHGEVANSCATVDSFNFATLNTDKPKYIVLQKVFRIKKIII